MQFIKKENLWKNHYLLFLPFLLIYITIVIRFHSNQLVGDEPRYLNFANNLIHGFYSTPAPDINLWNGPGYPLVLIPFVAFKIPTFFILILNAILYYLSVIFLFKSLIEIAPFKLAFGAAVFWGFYSNAYQDLLLRCTEVLTFFLLTLLLYFIVKIFKRENSKTKWDTIKAGVIFGYLILTKILFAYVLLFLFFGCLLLIIIKKNKSEFKKVLTILLFAVMTISPYLIYTYTITGKIFYLGNSGGMSLYWMSNTNAGEYGDWFDDYYFSGKPLGAEIQAAKNGNFLNIYEPSLKKNHQADFDIILKYKGVQRDSVYKQLAIKNIRTNPKSFFINYISNIGRLLFSYPFSYTLQSNKTLLRIPMSGLVFVLILFSLIPTIINWRRIPFSLKLIIAFLILYFGATTLLSAYTRMFTVAVPLLLYWIVYILPKTVSAKPFNSGLQ